MASKVVEIEKLVSGANKSEIHRQTGISLSHISRVFNGRRTPSTRKLRKLATELGVSMDDLDKYLSSKAKSERGSVAA